MQEVTVGARSSAKRNIAAAAAYLLAALALVLLEVKMGQNETWKWLFTIATGALLVFLVYPVLVQPVDKKTKFVALIGGLLVFLLIVFVTIVIGVNVKFLLGGTI